MPVTGKASGARITVRGGRKLRRFLSKVEGLTGDKMAAIMARILKRRLVPALRGMVPVRTGKLRSSLKIVQRGANIELRSVFYGRFVPVGPGRDSLAETAIDWLDRNRLTVRAELQADIKRELGL